MRVSVSLVLFCSLVIGAVPARAQDAPRSRISWGEIFDADEAWLVGGVAAGTAALQRVDSLLMVRAQDSTLVERDVLDPIARRLHFVGRPGAFVLAGGAFAVGRVLGNDGMSDLGLHTGSALLINELATRAIKGLVGRARPEASSDPLDFGFGRGFGNSALSSFPSGHTSSAFATAAVVQSELARHGSRYQVPAAIAMYGTASAIGLARVYDNHHWATDILAGAALGYLMGENVVEYAHHGDDLSPDHGPSTASEARVPRPRIPIFHLSIPVP